MFVHRGAGNGEILIRQEEDMNYQFFPRSQGLNAEMQSIVECFHAADVQINSAANTLKSDDVLAILKDSLLAQGYRVEKGKKKR
jgi:hypothetical protein